MSYYVTRAELQAILSIERSTSYVLEAKGILPKPLNGFGRAKLFDLKNSLEACHRALNMPIPDDLIVETHWRAIVASRLQQR